MSSKTRNIINWVLAELVAFIFLGSAVSKLTADAEGLAAAAKFGLSPGTYSILGIIEIVAVALFLYTRTGILGSFLLIAYMGGAISTHVEFAQPLLPPMIISAFVWIVAVVRFPELTSRIRGKIAFKSTNALLLATASMLVFSLSSCGDNQVSKEEMQSLQLVKDELDIRGLAEKFSDAANRKDGDAFQALWAENGVWKIGPPINMEFKGKANMGSSVTLMLGLRDFFVQMSGPGVVNITGDKATARFYVNEVARKADDKTGNYNLSMYEDELIKENGKWVFSKRSYNTIYQEAPNYTGLIQTLPNTK